MTGSQNKERKPAQFAWENNPKKNKNKKKPHTPKLPALPLLSSCSVSEGFAVRSCICVQPGNTGTILVFISTLSPTSSVETPSEPRGYCKLLILWFPRRFSCTGRNTGPGLLHSRSSTSQLPQQWLESKWFGVVNHRSSLPDSSAPKFHKMCQGLHMNAEFLRGGLYTL